MSRLPLLLAIPHGSDLIPASLRERCLLSPQQIHEESDANVEQIFGSLEQRVAALTRAEVARVVVDLNRAPDDFRKDGVVKTHTWWDVPIWQPPLTRELAAELLERYHQPYHARVVSAMGDPAVQFALGCHTMSATGPPLGPDPGAERPLVCLGNADGKSCPAPLFELLADCFAETFGEPPALNNPFRGGYAVRHHSAALPWAQVEVSRTSALTMDEKRQRVAEALERFCARSELGKSGGQISSS